jgi:hypothetical protein
MSIKHDNSEFKLSNEEFLNALFKDQLASGEFCWICSFEEDPKSGNWSGYAWDGKSEGDSPSDTAYAQNRFFSLSTFKNQYGGRKATNVASCIAVILDDVGTKATAERLPEPTWIIETSPDNFQYGYAFGPAITDSNLAKNFFKKLAENQGLTDTGGQNSVRYARLPNGHNTKVVYAEDDSSYPSTCLIKWNPELRYAPEVLAQSLGLDLSDKKSKRANAEDGVDVFEDALPENPVITRLKSFGLYKFEKALRTHEITCPWVEEHTAGVDDGTIYFEPTEEYPLGGFKCHHGHCSHRKVRDLCQYLGVNGVSASNRPMIRVMGGELHRIVAKCEELLHRAGYYQNGGIIVSVQSQSSSQGEVLSTVALDAIAATVELTRIAAWMRYDVREAGWVSIDAPTKYASSVVSATQRRHLRPISALSRQPFLRADGTVCRSAGYDSESQIFASFDPDKFPALPDCPTRIDAETAVQTLLKLLEEVPFKNPSDKSAALSMFLTAAIRPALPTAPGFLINAHSSGSGKSYLQDMAGTFATSETHLPSAAFMANDEELRKELLSKLLEAPAVIKWDEMKTDLLPVKALLSALTSERVEGRRLGQNQIIKVSTRSLMLFAGNNVEPINDMTRRVITIHIDPQMEDPATREFKRDALAELRGDRGLFIIAAFTIILAWQAAGSPYSSEAKNTVNGYGLWSDLCRQPLLWLGFQDPAANLFEALKSDPAKDELSRLIDAWENVFGDKFTSVKQAIKEAESRDYLREVLLEVAEGRPNEIDRKKLGYYLKKSLGRPINGRLFELDKTFTRSANAYRLARVSKGKGIQNDDLVENHQLTKSSSVPFTSYSSDTSYSANTEIVIKGSRKSRTNRNWSASDDDLSESFDRSPIALANTRPSFVTIDAFEV